MHNVTRREFLKMLTNGLLTLSGLLGLGGLFRFLEYQSEAPPADEFDLGPASDYPPGSKTVIPEVPAVLEHTESGFSALSLVCTHLGCSLEQDAQGFACPCHGSRFDPQGEVTYGPAEKQLSILRLEVMDDGHLHLFV